MGEGYLGGSLNAKRKRKNRRTLRIEELESREMLDAGLFAALDDAFFRSVPVENDTIIVDTSLPETTSQTSPVVHAPTLAAAPPANAHTDDLTVYNDLISRGCEDGDFTWDADGRITEMWVGNKGLSGTLDVSKLTNLRYLDCTNNQLATLNVAGLTNLEELYCYRNQLTELNVNGLTSLEYLDCEGNQLTELNVNGLTSLEYLACERNQLTELNVAGLTNLQVLVCFDNQLTTLNVAGLTNLEVLDCDNNQLTELNVTGLTNLQELYCTRNQLTELDLSGTPLADFESATRTDDGDYYEYSVSVPAMPYSESAYFFR